MTISPAEDFICFRLENTQLSFLSTGDIDQFKYKDIMINGFTGTKKEGSVNNIWLRIYQTDEAGKETINFYPLLGISSSSHLKKGENCLRYYGNVCGISYEITFKAARSVWFWDVSLSGSCQKADLIYGQDIGMAAEDALLENELYAAQYLSHTVFHDKDGYHLCSRQNLIQNGTFPYLNQGMLFSEAAGYSTDGMQFFGLTYKLTQIPMALTGNLENRNLQSESSYTALQSKAFSLTGSRHFTFYGCFRENHEEAVTILEFMDEIKSTYASLKEECNWEELSRVSVRQSFGLPYSSPEWSLSKICSLYPERILEEKDAEQLLSFFTPAYAHVALQQKELLTQRPHANIITTKASLNHVDSSLITSTNYINGFFNGQTVIGNTSRHKFLSARRGLLDLQKNSGQRIYVRIGAKYRLLMMPSLFETGFHYSKWFYEIEGTLLTVKSFAVSDESKIVTEISVQNDIPFDFIITNQLVMGTHEFKNEFLMEDNGINLRFFVKDSLGSPYPDLHYDLFMPDTPFTVSDDRIFFEDGLPQNKSLLTLSVKNKSHFQIVVKGSLSSSPLPTPKWSDFLKEETLYKSYYTGLLNHFNLGIEGNSRKELEILNVTAYWYAHNAMIHYAVPHGLEQPGGAAWGTRDVCQGPVEFFLAAGKFTLVRKILLNLYSHQFYASGEWPQWFMFDSYQDCQKECHGDVIFWPLKCLSDYVIKSGDSSILSEPLPYKDHDGRCTEPLSEHVKKAIASIKDRFLPGTFLISYAGGDWDDTLQPADEALKKELVSSWTQALSYQVLSLLAEALFEYDSEFAESLALLANQIKDAFQHYLIVDGIIPGFTRRLEDGGFCPMLHPDDQDTGIHLRLLPLTRSILSGLADRELMETNLSMIQKKLHFPDGVRLMDRPAAYHGGVCKLFKRAEQAANVGREISLQYVHAHIRYIEALCKAGKADAAWQALFEVNPVCIRDYVKNSGYRQSNLYFSSSDGDFSDRYLYSKEFDRLYDGTVTVNGGWRIYSSGPGIYLAGLIGGLLGIRLQNNCIIIDPVLPASADGLYFTYQCFDTVYTFIYHIGLSTEAGIRVRQNGKELPYIPVENHYRPGGIKILKKNLNTQASKVHIYLHKTY